HRSWHAPEPTHGTHADVQIEQLPQGDVQRSDAAADRRRQRTFAADVVLAERVDGLVGQPRVELREALFAGEHLEPRDAASAAVRVLHGGVEDANARAPDVAAGAVAFDE